jgi:Uma2 family endonuclease
VQKNVIELSWCEKILKRARVFKNLGNNLAFEKKVYFCKNIFNMTNIAAMPVKVQTPQNGSKPTKPLTWETFKSRYLSREDGYTYEFVNGQVEKTKRSMDYTQVFITQNLMTHFISLLTSGKVKGMLSSEVDTFFSESHRRPDMCYLTNEQIRLGKIGIPPVPQFVVEIISNNDKMKRVEEKMLDYWRAEVPVIWHIYPDLQVIHVYNGKNMVVCMGDDLCSAAPVLPDFVMSVNDIFK